MGHCLWTGIVDDDKAIIVAERLHVAAAVLRLGHPHAGDVDVGLQPGLATTTDRCGPTTTRSCAAGLMRYGFVEEAHRVIEALLAVAEATGGRLPELFAGLSTETTWPSRPPTRRRAYRRPGPPASPLLLLRSDAPLRTLGS